jgi:hypothetical protein
VAANDRIQWLGAAFIIAMHVLNAGGPAWYPWNLIAASLGTILFMIWSYRVKNRPQLIVNLVAAAVCTVGLYNAFG